MESGSVVIVAHRDARGSPATASLSGTATLIELARDLEGETLHRTVVLASTSGSQGTAGAIRLARTLGGPIDAVIVLGDLASAHLRQPIVVPWSDGPQVAPPMLRNTISRDAEPAGRDQRRAAPACSVSSCTWRSRSRCPSRARSARAGIPAVLLSLSGERGPAPDAPVAGPDQLTSVGRAVLSAISALDGGPTVPAASAYVLFDNKVVPGWAISVFVLALVVPVLLTTIDAWPARCAAATASGAGWLAVLLAAVPFALGVLVILGARAARARSRSPRRGRSPAGAVPLHGSGHRGDAAGGGGRDRARCASCGRS